MTQLPCDYLQANDSQIRTDLPINHSGHKFSTHIIEPGIYRLSSAKNVVLYAVEILNNRAAISIFDGTKRLLFAQPSTFTGSFVWQGYAEDGLIVRSAAGTPLGANITITWTESE